MSILKFKSRLDHFDYLVRHKMTGSPKQCAKRLRLSKSSFYRFLEDLILMNIPIAYNSEMKTYEYQEDGKLIFGFEFDNKLKTKDLSKIKGGFRFCKKKTLMSPKIWDLPTRILALV